MDETGEILDWSGYGVPASVEVRKFDAGMILFTEGRQSITLDTNDMTREEVIRGINVALEMLKHKRALH